MTDPFFRQLLLDRGCPFTDITLTVKQSIDGSGVEPLQKRRTLTLKSSPLLSLDQPNDKPIHHFIHSHISTLKHHAGH